MFESAHRNTHTHSLLLDISSQTRQSCAAAMALNLDSDSRIHYSALSALSVYPQHSLLHCLLFSLTLHYRFLDEGSERVSEREAGWGVSGEGVPESVPENKTDSAKNSYRTEWGRERERMLLVNGTVHSTKQQQCWGNIHFAFRIINGNVW